MSELIDGLAARGCSPLMSVRVANYGARKISVIKEVRALTGWGLARTKHAVEQGTILFEALTPARARAGATQLEAAGAVVEVTLARAHRYAYAPDSALRGGQSCARLSVYGQELVLERGRVGAWQTHDRLAGPGDDLLGAIDAQRELWAHSGLSEAADELEIIQRVSAQHPRLEAQLAAAEGDEARREAAVYGDWLQGQADPRGLIAALTLTVDDAVGVGADELARRRAALEQAVREHASHLLGPAIAALDHANFSWRGPMLGGLELLSAPVEDLDLVTELEQLLGLPVAAGLRELLLRGAVSEHPTLGSLLVSVPCTPNLRTLDIRDARRFACTEGRFERLERLALGVVEVEFGRLEAPNLRDLRIDLMFPPDDLAAAFAGLEAPRLRRFGFTTEAHDYWDQHHGPLQVQLRDLLALPSFAGLRSLSLGTRDRSLPLYGGLADVLLRAPASGSFEEIDLRRCKLLPQCRAELVEARGRLRGLRLPES